MKGLLALLILIPLLIGVSRYRTAGRSGRLFVFFLAAGLVTDLTMWIMIVIGKAQSLITVFSYYSLIEALFLFWFLAEVSDSPVVKTIARACYYLTTPAWAFFIFIYPHLLATWSSSSAPFDTSYEVIVSFLGGFILLQMVEKETSVLSSGIFWLTLGIFFYCFCTFYFMAFIETMIGQKIWFLNNIFNTLSYGLYSVGLWKMRTVPSIQR
ncbi:MAG: hypothetical protein WDN75_19300 [Bacteroidota bacterium]